MDTINEQETSEIAVINPPCGTARILIVDDEEKNLRMLARCIGDFGHSSGFAANGQQALEMLRQESYDLVLLDINMPVLGGFETLQIMRQDPDIKDIPVVMISALSDMETIAGCIEAGAEDYFNKPFNPSLLKARISCSLERKRMREMENRFYRKLEENHRALKETSRMRDLLVHMLVHDMRNPLQLISGWSELSERFSTEVKIKRNLERVRYAVNELNGLSMDLLNVSKFEARAFPVKPEIFDSVELLEQQCDYYRVSAELSKKSLVLTPAGSALPVLADKGLFIRVLQNLIVNAIRYSAEDGVIRVGGTHDKENVSFSVADKGPGVPDECKERVFDKFFQIEDGNHKGKFGTGLGLTFCKMAVEALKGRIWVDDNPCGGAVFRFTLPAPERL